MQRLSFSDRIAGGLAVLAALIVFLPWSSSVQSGTTVTTNGFRTSLFGDLYFVLAAVVVLHLLQRAEVIGEVIPERLRNVNLIGFAGAAMLVLVLAQMVWTSTATTHLAQWVALLLAVAVTVVGFSASRLDGAMATGTTGGE